MNPKVVSVLTLVLGLGFNGLVAWKGVSFAGVVFGSIGATLAAVSMLNAWLKIIPPKQEAYIEQLEGLVKEHAPADVAQKAIKS